MSESIRSDTPPTAADLGELNARLRQEIAHREAAELALRASEQRYRLIAEMTTHFAFKARLSTDGDLQIEWIVGDFGTISGYDLETVDGFGWIDTIVPEDLPRVFQSIERLLAADHDTYEFRAYDGRGELHWLRAVMRVLDRLHDGGLMIVGAILDVTERKQAQLQLQHLTRELERAQRANLVGELVAGVAHEVTQPLHAIANFARACLGALDAPAADAARDLQLRGWIESIARAVDRSSEVMRRLRALYRHGETSREPTCVRAALAEALELVQPLADELGATIELHVDDGLPPIVCDRVQVQQVVVNLARNAVEAVASLEPPRRQVQVLARRADEGIEIVVRDEGPGPEVEPLERLFEPFYSTKQQGTGLGLPISKTIVEAHGGTIGFRRRAPHGVECCFTLPETPPVAEPSPGPVVPAAREP